MSSYAKNVVRTVVPAIVGAVVAYLTKIAAHIPPAYLPAVTAFAGSVYYAAVRRAEEKWPKLSWLLGALPVK